MSHLEQLQSVTFSFDKVFACKKVNGRKKPKKDNNLSDQFSKGLNIRQTQWPPHPDREEEVQEPPAPWSPNGQQNGDIFDDTDVTDYVPHEEHDSKVVFPQLTL